jgi:RNA polymerase sigma factor (sigma-70 family)
VLNRKTETQLFQQLRFHRERAASLKQAAAHSQEPGSRWREAERHRAAAARVRCILVEHNLRLVRSIANQVADNSRIDLDDCISAGNAALLRAIDGFDVALGYRFSTYAFKVVRRAIVNFMLAESRVTQRLTCSHGEVDATAGLMKDAATAERAELAAREAREEVLHLMGLLDSREQTVLMQRFGMGHHQRTSSFTEIGHRIGVSKQRAATIFGNALEKLRSEVRRREVPRCVGPNAPAGGLRLGT